MASRFLSLRAAILCCAAFSTGAGAQKIVYFDGRPGSDSDLIQNQYICVFHSNAVSKGQVRSEAVRAAGPEGGRVLRDYRNSIRGFSVRIAPEGLQRMQTRNALIAYCEQDRIITLAPPPGKGPGSGDGGGTSGQSTPWGITRVGGAVESSNLTRTAWVIDSGIDLDHPDLNVDVVHSVDFTGSRNGPDDENGHGTHVAGTIAAKDNGIGVVGVAAGAKVVAVRVLDRRGSGSYSGVIAGVDYVAELGKDGDVANMSLGGPPSKALDDAVFAASARVKFAIAAGNNGADASNYSPARVDGPNIYTISAINVSGSLTSWSNWGLPVDYAEPGLSVESTWKDGGYNTISGTSMAAPHAAGILLLGAIKTDGTVVNDSDDIPDPIGTR
jgi:hypothetical protein